MLKGLVTWFLNNYLGSYLENLNADQLSIALLQGEVELENVPLRRDALRFIEPALDVKNGLVGRVKLKIPVSSLRSEPWSIVMEKVYVVVAPQCHTDYDELHDEAVSQEIKLAALDGIESDWRAKHDQCHQDSYSSSYTTWMSFGTSFIGTIVENLQVQICDVHIRFEDFNASNLFSCGVTLESLSAHSCDQNWIPKFIQRDPSDLMSFKLVELQNMAVYIDIGGQRLSDLPRDQLLEKMSTCNRGNMTSHQHIVGPISATAMIRRNCSEKPLNSKKSPRLTCNLELGDIELRISEEQYQSFVGVARSLQTVSKNRKYWRWRPHEPLKGNARLWWQYAITCHMEEIHEKRQSSTWENVLAKARQNVQYVAAFQSYLENPVIVDPETREFKSTADAGRSYLELKILREVAVRRLEQTRPKVPEESLDDGNANKSVLQGWFPLWWGWYSNPEQDVTERAQHDQSIPFEEELLEALVDDAHNIVPHRDVVFMQAFFTVHRCLLKLMSKEDDKVVFDLELTNAKMEVETRPRTQSNKLILSLEALFIRDQSTIETAFPILVSPQPSQAKGKGVSTYGQLARTLSNFMSMSSSTETTETIPLFHLLYEKKPFNPSKVDYRLHIKSQPLNIVYNPTVVDFLKRFFQLETKQSQSSSSRFSERLRDAAIHRIAEVKQQTMSNWIEDTEEWAKTWDLVLDLSAPQIVIPEHFVDKEATVLVLDLGKLHVDNGNALKADPSPVKSNRFSSSSLWTQQADDEDDDDDEEFVTPASSPTTPITEVTEPPKSSDVETGLRKRIYETFSIDLTDMQVIVGKLKDNWRHAQLKSHSSLHVLDRFNISLQLDRRLVASDDHLLPKFALSGNLPKLSVHINEEKVRAVNKIRGILFPTDDHHPGSVAQHQITQTLLTSYKKKGKAMKKSETMTGETNLVSLIYFCITELSVDIQSLGRSIVELQVTGVKASLTRRPRDTSLGLSVHSLLLVDAIQTIGANFELLAASHKNVSVDSTSGSLRGSDPVSPASPSSPTPLHYHKSTSPSDIAKALSSLQKSKASTSKLEGLEASDFVDPDSLINVEITYLDRQEAAVIISIQFNSLDLIANQETIIELMSFAKRVLPTTESQESDKINRRKMPTKDMSVQTESDSTELTMLSDSDWEIESTSRSKTSNSFVRTEVTAEYHRLSVLLLRAGTGKMIGTALITEARVHFALSNTVRASGSLGGLQVHSLLPGSHLHQRIVSIGKDPSTMEMRKTREKAPNIHSELYKMQETKEQRAFSFVIDYEAAGNDTMVPSTPMTAAFGITHKVNAELRMASVCYLHSSNFIRELNSCATDFRRFLSQLASSITSAATDLALGIVQRRTESISRQAEMTDFYFEKRPVSTPTASFAPPVAGIDLSLDVVLQTPIIVFPRANRSHEVLVGHLGAISIRNETETNPFLIDRTDRVVVSLADMNVYSLDLMAQLKRLSTKDKPNTDDALEIMSVAKTLLAEELYSCNSQTAAPMLHDTQVSIVLERNTFLSSDRRKQSPPMSLEYFANDWSQAYVAQIQVVNPLKVSLQRNQYLQILDTIQYVTKSEAAKVDSPVIEKNQSQTASSSGTTHVPIRGSVVLPKLIFEMCPERMANSKALVSVELDDFSVRFSKPILGKSVTEITLGSIVAQDLSCEDEYSSQRTLATSITSEDLLDRRVGKIRSGKSTSCPNLYNKHLYNGSLTGSLPENLNNLAEQGQGLQQPPTPPPSMCGSMTDLDVNPQNDTLVHIKITDEVDTTDFRFIDVDFNTLNISITQSWVLILDFFGIGSPKPSETQAADKDAKISGTKSSKQEMHIKVKLLSVVLNHATYEVARTSVNMFQSHLSWSDGVFTIEGSLGKFLVKDLTKSGQLYTDRFLPMHGHDDVLTFSFLKWSQEDPSREFDASINLRMASIIYVHTQRFYNELVAFFNNFHQHQNVMNRIRVAAMGSRINETAAQGLRLKLDVEAQSPLLLLPVSAASSRLLVVNLGFLRISNAIKVAGDSGTISSQTLRSALSSHLLQTRRRRRRSSSRSSRHSRRSGIKSPASTSSRRRSSNWRGEATSASEDDDEVRDTLSELSAQRCVLDVMSISLDSMTIRTADRISVFTENLTTEDLVVGSGFVVRQHPQKLLRQTCQLQLQVERNLDKAFNHQVPDLSINGSLSKVHATVDGHQYSMIRGMLSHNLGENTDDLAQFHASLPTNEYQEPTMQPLLSGLAWTCLHMNIGLNDVILDLSEVSAKPLARVSLLRSALTYESFSDGSRDVDLVSHDILLNDLRYDHLPMNKRPSVFSQILRPLEKEAEGLQAEVHFRLTPDTNRITILVNNMRLLGIFDWWLCLLDFLLKVPDEASPTNTSVDLTPDTTSPKQCSSSKPVPNAEEPLYPSSGILSRRAPVIDGPVFELKINITDCDFIIISDPSMSDSTAVILRSTSVLGYRPDMVDRPFSCNLNNAEVFSCLLNNEEESALSIIDPVTINIEIAGRNVPGMPSRGLSDLLVEEDDGYNRLGTYERTAEVQLQQLNVRLAYQDWLVFQMILGTFSKQANDALKSRGTQRSDQDVAQLMSMGFHQNDCVEALEACQGHLDEAALWLTQHGRATSPVNANDDPLKPRYFLEGSKISFTNVECKISSINICIIDDCNVVDVPLIDLSLQRLHLKHDFEQVGDASCILASSYYNRALSAWEPLMEPWKCSVGWGGATKRLSFSVVADETVNFNVTTTLMELYRLAKADYSNVDNWSVSQQHVRGCTRRRMPFTPFVIRNETGLVVWYRLLKKCSNDVQGWYSVADGCEEQFSFESNRNISKVNEGHQIILLVEGWQETSPITVDRVGTFFRKAIPMPTLDRDAPSPIRVVCDVSLKGTALKLITVRSSLLVENKLASQVELRLDNTSVAPNDIHLMRIDPGQISPVPLRYVWGKMTARPLEKQHHWKFSDKFIEWYHIVMAKESVLSLHTSRHPWRPDAEPQRFSVAVRRQNYPMDAESFNIDHSWVQPAHVITFLPPVVVVNLLPCHLMYKIKGGAEDSVPPGKESFVNVDTEQNVRLEFSMDSFPQGGELVLPVGRLNFESRFEVSDCEQRQLQLSARVESSHGGAARVSVYVKHWIVNKTGLPLIFRQEGSSIDAAGQEEANENARMAAPLMFTFCENSSDNPSSTSQVTMRLGNGLHHDSTSQWCRSFPIQPGTRVRKLFVVPKDSSRVSRTYIIGIDVRVGKGRYRDTLIVTLMPRFQVHNQTSHKVQFSQRCFATTFHDLEAEATHLQAFPQSCLAYHWPRLERDQLLCLRLFGEEGAPLTFWSGGVIIDRVDSFHLTLNDLNGKTTILRLEVSLIGATFCAVFSDADSFPPPFRIDNFSEVAINCHQVGVQDENHKTLVKAHQSVAFAWHEPTFPPHISCSAPGGSTATYNMNLIGEGSQLTYENFIYIEMSSTGSETSPLVFDVEGTKVFLAAKEVGKRSQLWRMTSSGMLQHEGSSPPQDPSRTHHDTMRNSLVLDIAGPAVQPNSCVPLMLRKPDDRRQLTQKWRFTDDGRLMCAHRGLYVQAKDGFMGIQKRGFQSIPSFGWQQWKELVLGPNQSLVMARTQDAGIPVEQAISRSRMRPGSGTLCVRVSTDGPTRVLQILDVNQSAIDNAGRRTPHFNMSSISTSSERELQITLTAKGGVGISLVSSEPPEELLYAFLSNVMIDYLSSHDQTTLDGSVQNIQVDNQMAEAQYPAILFLSPATRHDEYRHLPAVTFAVHRMISTHNNAEIYKHLMVQVKNMTCNLEEELLYKVFKFAGITRTDEEMERLDETAYETQYALMNATQTARRFYFGTLKLSLNQIKLSVAKSLKLPPDLLIVRRKLGLSLIAFEDAIVDLDPFVRAHLFETINFLTNSVVKHYTDELLSQAVLILGATDFLGNPIGFFNDISEGMVGLVSEGDVSGLFKNVAHGAANSAAKVTGSLSYGISKATVYDKYNEKRLMLRRQRGGEGKEYLVDGLKGLGFGVYQGLTSIVTETYEGVASDGLSGFFSGLTWGLIGTVSKPALGVLDLATGAATAVKESSRSSNRPTRLRLPRMVLSAGGCMPNYSRSMAQGQQLLHQLNGHDTQEIFIAHHLLRSGPENLQILISSSRILVFGTLDYSQASSLKSANETNQISTGAGVGMGKNLRIMMDISHGQLVCARKLTLSDRESEAKHYVELLGKVDDESSYKRPQVRCDTESLALLVSQQINFALERFEELQQAVTDP